jgi:hypothetical protein
MLSGADYARQLYGDVLGWYRSAENKAQIVLTLDGLIVSFLTSSLITNVGDVRAATQEFGLETWALLAVMSTLFLLSVMSAVQCLRSRTYSEEELSKLFAREGVDPQTRETYRPEVMWFFQMLGQLNRDLLEARLLEIETDFEVRARVSQIYYLSRNVTEKHRWVNRAFVFTGSSLSALLLAAVSYVARFMA